MEGPAVKKEPGECSLAERISSLLESHHAGISDSQLSSLLPGVDNKDRVLAINDLLTQNKLHLLKSGKTVLYKLRRADDAEATVPGGDNQERLIYQIISESGNQGIWIREIRYKSNLLLTQVNKILKSLEGKRLIKSVKSVNASKKKVYMLFELEPSRSVTGGAWYSDQDFESEFVDVLNQQCYQYLLEKSGEAESRCPDPVTRRAASYASSLDISKHIDALGISKVKLTVEDIETVLNTLIFDGKAEMCVQGAESKLLYRSVKSAVVSSPVARTPCGICPVFAQCSVGGIINPADCIYLNEWLKF